MKRLVRIFFFSLFFLLLYFQVVAFFPALASTEFETSYDVRYQVSPAGIAHVSQNISLTNKLSRVYATRYSLVLQAGQIENIKATDKEGPLKIKTQKENNQTKIELTFNEKVVGKNKTLNFNLAYEIYGLTNKTGQVWEVILPKLSDSSQIDNYNLTLVVPQSFGQLAFISPEPVQRSQEKESLVFHFTKNQLASSGVRAAFGRFQIFDFTLSYHLENPHLTLGKTKIALPSDTAYQRLFYQKIEPFPLNVEVDPDGNWLATYQLKKGEKLNITAVGKAKIFAQPQENFLVTSPQTLAKNLDSQPFWEIDDPLIQTKAEKLKTPEQIYNFVIKTLDYDFSRVEEGAKRLGALTALKNPQKAICMEFTDLFIALARAAGIPAREIDGYAYTTNPKLRPLSLVADVLHSWPEYWNEEKQIWIPVDPTWGETTGGVDYFNKVDLNHFVFVIHGQNSQEPYPVGSYKTKESSTKDVQVAFGQYEVESPPQIEVKFEIGEEIFFEFGEKGKVIIQNKGPSAIYNLPLEIEVQGLTLHSSNKATLAVLPPFGYQELPLHLSSKPFKFGQGNLTVFFNDKKFEQPIKLRSLVLERILPLVIFAALLTFAFFRVKIRLKKNEKRNIL